MTIYDTKKKVQQTFFVIFIKHFLCSYPHSISKRMYQFLCITFLLFTIIYKDDLVFLLFQLSELFHLNFCSIFYIQKKRRNFVFLLFQLSYAIFQWILLQHRMSYTFNCAVLVLCLFVRFFSFFLNLKRGSRSTLNSSSPTT